MLDTNKYKDSSCAFAEQMVSSLYDETDAHERIEFKTHLKSCATCAEEFASFSIVRSSVIEWRNEEFLSLEIPQIEIPYENTREFYKTDIDSKDTHSWFEELRKLFTLSPALTASASFAVIAVCIGFIFFAGKSTNIVDVADINSESTGQIMASPKVGNENLSGTASTDGSEKEIVERMSGERAKALIDEVVNNNRNAVPDANVLRKNSVVKVADVSRSSAKNYREANSPKIKAASIENKKSTFAQTGKIPRLNNVEEEEDESLRLAELLEDGDAK